MQMYPLRVLLHSVFDTFELRSQETIKSRVNCLGLGSSLRKSPSLQEPGFRKVALGTGLGKVPGRGFREPIPKYAAFLQPPLRNQKHFHMASIWKTIRS